MLSFKGQVSLFHQIEIRFFFFSHHLLKGQPFSNDLFQHLLLKINWPLCVGVFLNSVLCCIDLFIYSHVNAPVLTNTNFIVNLAIISRIFLTLYIFFPKLNHLKSLKANPIVSHISEIYLLLFIGHILLLLCMSSYFLIRPKNTDANIV